MVRKIIKKITATTSYVLLVLIILPGILWGVIRLPAVQDYSVSRILAWLSQHLGTELSYSDVSIVSLNRITFDDLFIADQRGDTLLYSKKAIAVTPVIMSIIFNESADKILLKKLQLEKSTINFVIDSSSTINFQFIIDYLTSGKSSSKGPVRQKIQKITITDSRFVLRNETSEPDSSGIDFGNMRLNHLNLKISGLTIYGDTINLDITPLSFVEHSGFQVKDMYAHLELCKSHMNFSGVEINTRYSSLEAEQLSLFFDKYSDFSVPELYTKVRYDFRINESMLNLADLGYFTDFFMHNFQPVNFSGNFTGPLSNLKGRDFRMVWGERSHLEGSFDIRDLPDVPSTFLVFNLKELISNTADINSFNLPGNKKLNLPASLQNIENIHYQGNFTGFFNDFVSYGKLTTNLGILNTDIMITPDPNSKISFSGKLSTQELNIGRLLGNEHLVKDISLDASITGSYSDKEPLLATIQGNISKFTLKDYPYRNIKINGSFSDRKFNGDVSVDDPNLKLEFNGLVDMAAEANRYDFIANVIDANLYALNLTKNDPEYHASFFMKAKAEGENFDKLNGEFHLLNSLFTKTNKQIQVFDFNVFAVNNDYTNQLKVRSELLDADITGKYKLSVLRNELLHFLYSYIPALATVEDANFTGYSAEMDIDVRFKRTQPFFDFFVPDYFVSENSVLHCNFYPGRDNFMNLTCIAPEVKVKSNHLEGLILDINSTDSVLLASIGSRKFYLSESASLDNFTLEARTTSNKTRFKTRWINWDSALYKGSFSGESAISGKWPHNSFHVEFDPFSLTISDSVWNLKSFALQYDSSGIAVQHLILFHGNQYISANGKLSDIPGDSMHFSFNNFDLANVNLLTRSANIELTGLLNGTGNMTGLKKQPLFFSSLNIDGLSFNKQEFGNCIINSLWDNENQSLNIVAESKRGKLKTLQVEGDYYPTKNGKMDFEITLDKLNSDILNPFVKGIFSDIRGLISGHMYLTGIASRPSLSGKLKLQKNSFTVDYLKTRYNFTSDVEIINNNVVLDDIQIFDQEVNNAILSGMIRTEYLKDIMLNINISTNNLQCLNTKETDNSMFYGTAYATGTIKIKGSPSTLKFDIDAATGKNTRIMIPLSQNLEVSEYNYITFIRTDTSSNQFNADVSETEQVVNLSGMQMDFNLDVTPDAEVQIVFDPTIGDIIKARGSGAMKLSINTLGTFEMFGEYVIDKGDYLFTLQNLINKHLDIEQGSTMRWTGDPFNATVNITAKYQVRAPLSDLLGEVYTDRVTVDCKTYLTGMLMSPDIGLDLTLPYSDDDLRNRVKSKISEEELSKQFLSLLVMNRFLPPSQGQTDGSSNEGIMAAYSNASEMLSNQLNNWLSQISNDVNVDVSYRPGGGRESDEVEVALSTQLLNDRLSINGSIDYQTNAAAQNSDKFAGDFDIDYKINKKGKVRVRAFNRSNDEDIIEESPYTQGLGIFYKEEFDSFGELLGQYWAALTGRKKKNIPEEADTDTN